MLPIVWSRRTLSSEEQNLRSDASFMALVMRFRKKVAQHETFRSRCHHPWRTVAGRRVSVGAGRRGACRREDGVTRRGSWTRGACVGERWRQPGAKGSWSAAYLPGIGVTWKLRQNARLGSLDPAELARVRDS